MYKAADVGGIEVERQELQRGAEVGGGEAERHELPGSPADGDHVQQLCLAGDED